jgi:hypothetical protein
MEPVVSKLENMTLYIWEKDDAQPIKFEPYKSANLDLTQRLFYSSIPDWKFISNWYKDLVYNKLKSDYVLKETIAELLKGKENLPPLEKARIFYEYILNNISYSNVSFLHSNFIPQKASRTITTKLGDCKDVSTLFVALCKESGINSNLVLISTRNYGSHTMPLPVIDFNHCIAQLNIDGKTWYLELTDNDLPFRAALINDLHSEILPIPLDEDSVLGRSLLVMDMAQYPINQEKKYLHVEMDGNNLNLSCKQIGYASQASSLRGAYKEIGTEKQSIKVTQLMASIYNAQVKIDNLSFENLDNLADSVVMKYQFTLNNSVQDVSGMKILKLPWGVSSESMELVSAEKREYPLELWAFMDNDVMETIIDFQLPAGLKFMEIPKDVAFNCASASFSMKYNLKSENQLIVTRRLSLESDRVTPEEYPEFRAFMTRINEYDNKQYGIH